MGTLHECALADVLDTSCVTANGDNLRIVLECVGTDALQVAGEYQFARQVGTVLECTVTDGGDVVSESYACESVASAERVIADNLDGCGENELTYEGPGLTEGVVTYRGYRRACIEHEGNIVSGVQEPGCVSVAGLGIFESGTCTDECHGIDEQTSIEYAIGFACDGIDTEGQGYARDAAAALECTCSESGETTAECHGGQSRASFESVRTHGGECGTE